MYVSKFTTKNRVCSWPPNEEDVTLAEANRKKIGNAGRALWWLNSRWFTVVLAHEDADALATGIGGLRGGVVNADVAVKP
jgi:hypothetical protein